MKRETYTPGAGLNPQTVAIIQKKLDHLAMLLNRIIDLMQGVLEAAKSPMVAVGNSTNAQQTERLERIEKIINDLAQHPPVTITNGQSAGGDPEQLRRLEEKVDQLIQWLPGLANAK